MSEDDPSRQSVSISKLSEANSPSQQIITLVGEKSGTPLVPDAETDAAHALPPLHSVIDPDALDALVNASADSPGSGTRIEFSYHGYLVTVCTDRPTPTVRLQPEYLDQEPCPSASAGD